MTWGSASEELEKDEGLVLNALLDIWRNIGRRIHVYTYDTAYQIPEVPGVYAWFLPLWQYSDNLDDLLKLLVASYSYDPKNHGTPERSAGIDFNWHRLDLRVRERIRSTTSAWMRETWERVQTDETAREAFKESLMEASIVMPPLYVGKADNLLSRYQQHLNSAEKDRNTFGRRFQLRAREVGLSISVGDLLFVCISTAALDSPESHSGLSSFVKREEVLRAKHANELLERMLLAVARPPYSER